jgi:hypothetical protein
MNVFERVLSDADRINKFQSVSLVQLSVRWLLKYAFFDLFLLFNLLDFSFDWVELDEL